MHVPFCEYETIHCEYRSGITGRIESEVIAAIKDCGHSHWYRDFDARLKRKESGLHLGFKRKTGCFVVYRFDTEVVRLKSPQGEPAMSYAYRIPVVMMEMKWLIAREVNGGAIPEMVPRMPGEWVFRELFGWSPEAIKGDVDARADEVWEQQGKQREKETAELNRKIEAIVHDSASTADSGNPLVMRTAVRVPEKSFESVACTT